MIRFDANEGEQRFRVSNDSLKNDLPQHRASLFRYTVPADLDFTSLATLQLTHDQRRP